MEGSKCLSGQTSSNFQTPIVLASKAVKRLRNCLAIICAVFAISVLSTNISAGCSTVNVPAGQTAKRNTSVTIPLVVNDLTGLDVISFDYTFTYNPAVLTYNGFDQTGTLSDGMVITINPSPPGTLVISGYVPYPLIGSGTLINLNFTTVGPIGSTSSLNLPAFMFNENTPCSTVSNGDIEIISGNVSGVVNYANSVSFKPVPNTVLSAPGAPSVSTNSAFLTGAYSFGGFGPGAYNVTPSKTGDVNGITGFDSGLIAQHVVNLITLSPTALLAADVSQAAGVTSFDAGLIARWVANLPGYGITSDWIFDPTTRFYSVVEVDQVSQNYGGILMGEVSGNWVAPVSLVENPEKEPLNQLVTVNVTAPNTFAFAGTNFTVPITTGDLSPGTVGTNVISYQFVMTYDPAIIIPQSPAVSVAGTISENRSVTINQTVPGTLQVVVFGSDPFIGAGTLFNLRFTAVGSAPQVSPLTWTTFMFNEGDPGDATTNGSVTLLPPTAASVSVSGRVLTQDGVGLRNAIVTATDTQGVVKRTVSSSLGYYSIDELQAGQTYVINVASKRFQFTPRVVTINEELSDFDLIALSGE